MPTKHSRIAVTRDEELDRALRETRELLTDREARSTASHLRTLALCGARALGVRDKESAELWEILEREHGVRPPQGSLADLPPLEGEVNPNDPYPATDALNWVRGHDRDP